MEFVKFLAPALVLVRVCSLLSLPGSTLAVCPLLTPPSAFFPSIPYVSSSPVTSRVSAELESIITSNVDSNSIPLYAVSVVHEDQIVFTSGLTTSHFLIGSISKTFTALGALILRDRGLLSLDDPVKKFLPTFSIINPYEPHDITLRELMGHVAGLPRELCPNPYVKEQSEEQCPVEESDVLKAVAKMELIQPPWSRQPAYSNLGFGLLGHSWEKVIPSKSWQEFVMEEIVKPLGLNDTGVDLTNVTLAANESAAQYDIGWVGPAGTIYSTAADLAKYLIFILNASPALVSAATIREWTSSIKLFPDGSGGFALPWEVLLLANSTGTDFLITKNGILANYMTMIGIHAPTQLGISVLFSQNQSSIAGPGGLLDELFNVLIPLVETRNSEIIDSVYAGQYVCKRTAPIFSELLNATVEILGGAVNIEGSPSLGLSAILNISLIESGVGPSQVLRTSAMLLKNATENSFWLGSAISCLDYFQFISANPTPINPNDPGTLYLEEIKFDLKNKTLQWPAYGAVCAK